MSNDYLDKESREDALLDRLIRAGRRDPEEGFVRPDADTITAYVLGTATQEQKAEVIAALCKSAAFCREILHMMEDVEALVLQDPLANKKKEEKRIVVPSRRKFLEAHGERVISPPEPERFWARLWRWRVPQIAVPVAVAAVAVVIVSVVVLQRGRREAEYVGSEPSQLPSAGGQTETVEAQRSTPGSPTARFSLGDLRFATRLAPLALRTFKTRGAAETQEQSLSDTPQTAAIAEFKSLVGVVTVDESTQVFQTKPNVEHETPPSTARVVTVRLAPTTGRDTLEFKVQLPQEIAAADSLATLWILTLPSEKLYSAGVPSDSVEFAWGDSMELEGCLTITYPMEQKYRAADGFTFKFE